MFIAKDTNFVCNTFINKKKKPAYVLIALNVNSTDD